MTTRQRLNLSNTAFMATFHLIAVFAIVYMAAIHFSWWTVGLAVVWFGLSGLAITAGYHRLFAHRAYKAHPIVRAVLLLFGAAAVQNSVLRWAADHRLHHARTDRPEDPYSISRGFWWAHIGWILWESEQTDAAVVADLREDPLCRLQDRHYILLACIMGAAVPAAIATIWGDPLGGLLVAGILRLTVQWHATFAINSIAHMLGSQPYSQRNSARDSWVTALITFGEGYHNFHHRFKSDYRNGIRWYQFDPTKWLIWSLSKVGGTSDLKRFSPEVIAAARREQTQRVLDDSRARIVGPDVKSAVATTSVLAHTAAQRLGARRPGVGAGV